MARSQQFANPEPEANHEPRITDHGARILISESKIDFSNWTCPLPLADYPTIVMGHGGGGKLGNELVEHLFLPAFRNPLSRTSAMRQPSTWARAALP